MKDDVYSFRIDAFTPATLPMARLAEYMVELAKLLGNAEKVHFKELRKGSAVLVSSVEPVAAPKVRERLTRIDAREPSEDVVVPYRKLDSMLAADNAVGKLQRGTATIIKFPGRTAPRPKFGPVTQHTSVQGQLVRIGGRDKTAHGQIEDVSGAIWRIVTTREEARLLAPLIYGPTIRATGSGRWIRSEDGAWVLEEMRLHSWEQLKDESLREAVEKLRNVSDAVWRDDADPVGTLARIRDGDGDGEVH